MPEADRSPSASSAPSPVGEPLVAGLRHSLGLGALAGAALGAVEAARWIVLDPPRTGSRALDLLGLAVVGDALVGAALALPLYALARLLWRPVGHRAAPASACAALGAAIGIAAWIGPLGGGPRTLVAAGVAGTLACLTLRELLAWWTLPTRARTWIALLGVALVVALIAGLRVPGGRARAGTSTSGPDVLFVSIDTLRADHLGCYGAQDAHTPVIDALAAEGVLFEDATSQANTTGPSHTTMLTGLLPAAHGALSNGVPVARSVITLPDVLADGGWNTAAFVSGFTLVDELCGLAERFGHYDDDLTAWSWLAPQSERLRWVDALIAAAARRGVAVLRGDRPARETVDRALAWLDRREGEPDPWFLFVHLYDPHAPYEAPAEYTELHDGATPPGWDFDWYALDTDERRALVDDERALEHMRARYRGEISYADAQVGRLIEHLRAAGTLDDTLIVLTSDHGEGLGAHDYFFDHGTFLYDEELHVPLILRLPRAEHAGARVAGQVRLLDLAPTLLELADPEGAARAPECTGKSLVPLFGGGAAADDPRPSFAIAEFSGELSGFPLEGRRLSLRKGGKKLILTSEHWLDTERVAPRLEAFDLDEDPFERSEAWGSGNGSVPISFGSMQDELEAFDEATRDLSGGDDLPPDVLERLRELGYL